MVVILIMIYVGRCKKPRVTFHFFFSFCFPPSSDKIESRAYVSWASTPPLTYIPSLFLMTFVTWFLSTETEPKDT